MKIYRLFIIALIFSLFVIGVHTLVYGSIFTKLSEITLSNSLFVVGILVLFPTAAVRLGSANLFLGFRYSIYRFINSGKLKEYGSISEFIDDKRVSPKGWVINEILLVSLILVIISYMVALNWSP